MKHNSNLTKGTHLTIGLAALAAGAYKGFCDSQGIPVGSDNLEFALKYFPTIAHAGVDGLRGGPALSSKYLGKLEEEAVFGLSKKQKITHGTIGFGAGIVTGGVAGAIAGALETVVGYGVGYAAGWATK
jgi:hypothetical protein